MKTRSKRKSYRSVSSGEFFERKLIIVPERELRVDNGRIPPILLPNGNMATRKISSAEDFGSLIRSLRSASDVTQSDLALTSGTNRRFIVDLEKGKPTCQLGKALRALQTLGAKIEVSLPPGIDLDEGD